MDTHTKERPARAMAVWPRRHGKGLTALFSLLAKAHDRVGMYWHGLPSYEQARKSCWTAFRTDTGKRLMDNVFPREIRRRPTEFSPGAEMLVELNNGSIIQFVGSDMIDSIVGAGPVGLNADEYALWRPSAIDLIRPMLRESRGWAAYLTTPRGRNHAYKLFKRLEAQAERGRAFVSHRTIYNAGRYSREEADQILEEERAEGMLEELLEQEYLCSWSAANVGSYWGDLINVLEMSGAMDDFELEDTETYVVFDLGYDDATSIWAFQLRQGGLDVVAHYSNHSKGMAHYFDQLDEWSKIYGFKYVKVFLPHDARQHHMGESVLDQAVARYSMTQVEIVPKLDPINGIQAARWLLQQDIRFHPRCEQYDGIEALRSYHRKYDDDKRAFSLHPDHDWSSHSADAFRYLAVVVKTTQLHKRLMEARVERVSKPRVITATEGATLGTVQEIFAEMARQSKRRRSSCGT